MNIGHGHLETRQTTGQVFSSPIRSTQRHPQCLMENEADTEEVRHELILVAGKL